MAYAIITGRSVKELLVDEPFTDAAGNQHPANWSDLYSPKEIKAIGIHLIEEPPVPAPGYVRTGLSLSVQDGKPVRRANDRLQPIEEAQRTSLSAADAEYRARIAAGFPAPMLGDGSETLQVRDAEDKANWLSVMTIAGAEVANGNGDRLYDHPISTTANLAYTLTNSEALLLMRGLFRWASEMRQAHADHKQAIRAARTRQAVDAVDLSAGWPPPPTLSDLPGADDIQDVIDASEET